MRMEENTILITGGATGIGLSLAQYFLDLGNEVIVCSRSKENLRAAKEKFPQLITLECDVSKEDERRRLHEWTMSHHPDLNVLINNAGIQRTIDLKQGTEELLIYAQKDGEDEIDVNLKAYVYLTAHFIPDLLRKREAAIINVGSGLAFIPIAIMPVYSATKAAIHSFSVSLRHQLRDTSIKVFELIPPTVNTNLDKGARRRRGQVDLGIPPEEVARAAVKCMERDELEIVIGMAQGLRQGSRENFEQMFFRMNR